MFLSVKKVCERYDITRDTVVKWVKAGKFPKPLRLNGAVRWDIEDLQKWEKTR